MATADRSWPISATRVDDCFRPFRDVERFLKASFRMAEADAQSNGPGATNTTTAWPVSLSLQGAAAPSMNRTTSGRLRPEAQAFVSAESHHQNRAKRSISHMGLPREQLERKSSKGAKHKNSYQQKRRRLTERSVARFGAR